jgi:hypothetical protein
MIIVGVVLVAAGTLLTMWWMSRTPAEPAAPAATAATDVPDGSDRPKPQPLSLPPLDESDTMLRDLVSTLSRHPMLTRLLATDGLVRRATLSVIQIGEGRTPNDPLEVLRPDSRVRIVGTESGRVDPDSYARWDAATAALTSIDPAELAQVYVNIKPLLDDAYREQGYPDANFDEAIVQAMEVLSSTPSLSSEPTLIRRPDYYIHDDPKLRALRPVQKQFLLFGPENQRKVMDWLQRFAAQLDLDVSRP